MRLPRRRRTSRRRRRRRRRPGRRRRRDCPEPTARTSTASTAAHAACGRAVDGCDAIDYNEVNGATCFKQCGGATRSRADGAGHVAGEHPRRLHAAAGAAAVAGAAPARRRRRGAAAHPARGARPDFRFYCREDGTVTPTPAPRPTACARPGPTPTASRRWSNLPTRGNARAGLRRPSAWRSSSTIGSPGTMSPRSSEFGAGGSRRPGDNVPDDDDDAWRCDDGPVEARAR